MKPLFFIFILILFSAGSCKRESIIPMKEVTYLALGDSYTIGESVDSTERYPYLLSKDLEKFDIRVKERKIIATTGWTTTNLKDAIVNAGINGKKYDMVSLLIGVNNQYQGRSLEEYKTEFEELLNTSITFANGNKDNVFVISIPDYGYTPFGQSNQTSISLEIDQFNEVNKKIADSLGVMYFDITPISRNGLSDPDLVASDGLHPSGKMYQQWVNLMIEEVAARAKN